MAGFFHARMGPREQEPTWQDDTGTQNENVDEPQGTQDESTDWEAKYTVTQMGGPRQGQLR